MNTRPKKAFISHATSDDKFVVELKNFILGLGYETVFNDADYSSIAPDQPFWPRIVDGIKTADALVIVISTKSVESKWVSDEVKYARSLGKKVLPILIEDCTIPELFRDRDVIDFRRDHRNLLGTEASRPLRIYMARLLEVLARKQGVLNYLPRVGSVEGADDDEFGYSVLVERTPGATPLQMPLSEATSLHRVVVMTGEPGAGKSTAIRRMAHVMAKSFDAASGNGTLPILIDLTQWGPETTLDDAIKNAFLDVPELSDLIRRVNYSVFLDGLNEVSDRDVLARIVRVIRSSAPRAGPIGLQHLIITCRSIDYDAGKESLKQRLGLPSITISPLAREEIEGFCRNYLDSSAQGLKRIIERSRLWELASNAFMLCALIAIYEQDGADAFPTSAAELFPRLTRSLLKRERTRGYSGALSDTELTVKLGSLAYWVTSNHGFGDFSPAKLPGSLDPDGAVTELARRCGLLRDAGACLRFSHQLTQEYFNAVSLKETKLSASARDVHRLQNSFRILGGLDAGSLGQKLFELDSWSLVTWVRGGVYTPEQHEELVGQLLELPPHTEFGSDRGNALEAILKHDTRSSTSALLLFLEREPAPDRMDTHTVVAILETIERLSSKSEQTVLRLLEDQRHFLRQAVHRDYNTIAPATRISIRELAASKLLDLGSTAAKGSTIEKLRLWLDDSQLVETRSGFSGIGSESTKERLGNRAFELLCRQPANHDTSLRNTLLKWLEREEGSEGVARIDWYDYIGAEQWETKTSQSEWAKNWTQKLIEFTN